MKDKDIELLMAEYRQLPVSDLQIQKWKGVVQNEVSKNRQRRRSVWLPLVAASILGFVLGGWVFSDNNENVDSVISSEDATIEYIYVKNN